MNAKQKAKRRHRKRKEERKWAKRVLKLKSPASLAKLYAYMILHPEPVDSQEFNWWERRYTPPTEVETTTPKRCLFGGKTLQIESEWSHVILKRRVLE